MPRKTKSKVKSVAYEIASVTPDDIGWYDVEVTVKYSLTSEQKDELVKLLVEKKILRETWGFGIIEGGLMRNTSRKIHYAIIIKSDLQGVHDELAAYMLTQRILEEWDKLCAPK
jgi:hypothetical protein